MIQLASRQSTPELSVQAEVLTAELETDGIVTLPPIVSPEQLAGMQKAFEVKLRRMRWNDLDGYEKTERLRHMVQDVLLLDQGFVDLALNPLAMEVIRRYVGPQFTLVEAKGWRSLPTKRDFHGWHGDAWYDQETVKNEIPREVKLACYLTDVESGGFNYIKGSHARQAPRTIRRDELPDMPADSTLHVTGAAGTAFLFDTSGIHRQSVPILKERNAVFLNYHDPNIPLQKEDVDYYRYHPLLLNAAFLGNLTGEDQRILGFGDKANYIPHYERRPHHRGLQCLMSGTHATQLFFHDFFTRVGARLKRLFGRK